MLFIFTRKVIYCILKLIIESYRGGKVDLAEKEQIYNAIINNVSDEVIVFDKDGQIIKINNSAKESYISDYSLSDNLNEIYKNIETYGCNGNLTTIDKMVFKRVLKGEKIINERYGIKHDKGFTNKEGSGIPIYDSEGNITAGVLILREVAKKLEYDEILISQSHYETLTKIIDTLDLCFARFTYPEFDVIEFNNKAYDLIRQVNSSNGSQLLLNELSIYTLIPAKNIIDSVGNSFSLNDNYEDLCKYVIAGKEIYYKYIYQPLYGKNNNIAEIITIGIDVTKEVKSRLKMEKALKIQDEIYANVSHELKTPLSVIFSANQMMDMYMHNIFENKNKLIEYNNIVKQNCYRLSRLINNIVDISKNNTGNLKLNQSNENIVEVVENIVQSVSEYAKSRELKIIFDTDVEEKIILCDAIQIERIMLNLISNAIKFSNPNGVIYVNITDKKYKVEISVKDEGVGIEAKHLAHIFQRYYQVDKSLNRNAEGSGIGLAMTKALVEAHGGKIYAKSKVNEGSTFIVELPVKTAEDYSNKRYIENEKNLIERIRVEFSDIYNI